MNTVVYINYFSIKKECIYLKSQQEHMGMPLPYINSIDLWRKCNFKKTQQDNKLILIYLKQWEK